MQVKDLIVTGDAKILGNLYANGGSVSGSGGSGSSDGSGLTYKLTKSGSTITLTGSDGSTSSVTDANTDTNTTYSAGTGISLSGTTFSNSGVRSIATGSSNGTISVNTNGSTANVAVKGLGSAAYTASTAYAASSHTHSYLPLSGGKLTGDLTLDSGSAGVRTLTMYYREGNNISIAHSLKSSFGGIRTAGALTSDYVLRNEKLSTSAENPSTNGTICWQYA